MANISDIRNIVLLGHGGSGKTSLAEAILTILEDPSLAEKMRQRGRDRIEQESSWVDTVGKTLDLYDSVITQRKS